MDFYKKDSFKKTVVLICRILLGIVFIFSGYAKAVDPLGGTYKIEDYLSAFGLDFLSPIAFIGSIALSSLEFLLGVCMLLGANMRSTSRLTLLFMCVMTPLTLYIALFNPVSDCGCFGDALKISNWATFWKNVVFITLAIIVFLWYKHSPKLFSQHTEWLIAIYAGLFATALSIYGYINLPIIDFRPYKIGTDIAKSMEVPEGAETDQYKTTLIYQKDGVEKEFTLENYPKDSSWTFVRNESVLIKKGYEPPIHDFTLYNEDGDDLVEQLLEEKGYTFILVSSRIEKAYTNQRDKINALYEYAKANGHKFYCATSTGLEAQELKEYIREANAEYPFVNTDEITLKTIVRSNPGLVLIKDGIIINKWSNKNMPTLEGDLDKIGYASPAYPNDSRTVLISLILFCIPLICIYLVDKGIIKLKK